MLIKRERTIRNTIKARCPGQGRAEGGMRGKTGVGWGWGWGWRRTREEQRSGVRGTKSWGNGK